MTANKSNQILDDLPIKELLKEDELALLDFENDKLFMPNFDVLNKFLADYGFEEVIISGIGDEDEEDEMEGICHDFLYRDDYGDLLKISGQLGVVAVPLNNLILTQFGLVVSRKAKVYAARDGREEEVDLYEFAMRNPRNIKQEYFSRTISELVKREQRNSGPYR